MFLNEDFCFLKNFILECIVFFVNLVRLEEGWLKKNSKKKNLNKFKIFFVLNIIVNSIFVFFFILYMMWFN